MAIYELCAISTSKAKNAVAFPSLIKNCSKFILDRGGVVSGLTMHRKDSVLPYRMKKNGEKFSSGDTWFLTFNASPQSMLELRTWLKVNDSVLRATICKGGDSLSARTGYIAPQDLVKYTEREAVIRREGPTRNGSATQ